MGSRVSHVAAVVVFCFVVAPLYGQCPSAPGLTLETVSGPSGIFDVPTFADGNIARAPDAVTFSTHWRAGHNSTFINDGNYGDQSIIFFRGPEASSGEVYAGIYWTGGGQSIAEVAISRDNTGGHANLVSGSYTVEYTTDVFTPTVCGDHTTPSCDDSANVAPAVEWCSIGVANAHNGQPDEEHRRRYSLDTPLAGVTAIRVLTASATGGLETIIDEIEVGDSTGSLLLDPCPLAPGLTFETTSGPTGIFDVPTFADGNIARAADAVVFATHHRIGHDASFINDGMYGDQSIIFFRGPEASSGQVYAGIYWAEGGQTVAELAISRDNTGGHANLVSGNYTFEYTMDDFTPTVCGDNTTPSCDDSANFVPKWCPLGVANEHNGEPDEEHRRRYSLNTPLTGVRAIRVITTSATGGLETIIDELEVGDSVGSLALDPCPPPRSFALLETGGPETTPAFEEDVPTFAAGNLARAPDAVTFATHFRGPGEGHNSTFINDGLYGDQSILFLRGPEASSGQAYAGIYWSGGAQTIAGLAIGRDNTGVETNLISATYTFEYTTDVFTPTVCGDHTTPPCDDSGNFVPKWCPMGVVRDHCPAPGSSANFCHTNPDAWLRHRYDVVPDLTGVRAVRVIMNSPSGGTERIIDELEIFGEPTMIESGQIAGDCNQDGGVDLSDVIHLLGFLFQNNPPNLPCATATANLALMNVNGDPSIDLSDGIYMLAFLFQGGPEPVQGALCFSIPNCPQNQACP